MMSDKNVELKMNALTYKKILGKTFGIDDYSLITKLIPNINGITIVFDDSLSNDNVKVIANYIPHTRESLDVEIL
ncbi:MAG: hypothetical protein Q8T03_13545 [Bacteroidota bacterium]|nr:hypothetical protein [Bacteroidota bacterium]